MVKISLCYSSWNYMYIDQRHGLLDRRKWRRSIATVYWLWTRLVKFNWRNYKTNKQVPKPVIEDRSHVSRVTRFPPAHSGTITSPKHRGWGQPPWATGGRKGAFATS